MTAPKSLPCAIKRAPFCCSIAMSPAVPEGARTIGRPSLAEIIPGLSITDPDSLSTVRTITAINTGLKPWTADNYDFSFEAYGIKGAVASVGLFRNKDIKNFFGTIRTGATVELLNEFGLSDDYLDYDASPRRTLGRLPSKATNSAGSKSCIFCPHGPPASRCLATRPSLA